MKFTCPHCGANAFRLLAGANGMPAAECLSCGRASTFDQSLVSNPAARPGTPKPDTNKIARWPAYAEGSITSESSFFGQLTRLLIG
jgi:hypothetical protein